MTQLTSVIVALKTTTFILGGVITYFAFKAYRRTNSRSLQLLALGFGVVTLGSMLAGVVDQVLMMSRDLALTIESSLTVVGFAIIVYSLYAE
jgi:energy-converting hydrogenase Eha subunit F